MPDEFENLKQDVMGLRGDPTPPKSWSQCTIDEKIERLAGELRTLRHHRDHLTRAVYELTGDFYRHFHGPDGRPAVPAGSRLGGEAKAAKGFDPLA